MKERRNCKFYSAYWPVVVLVSSNSSASRTTFRMIVNGGGSRVIYCLDKIYVRPLDFPCRFCRRCICNILLLSHCCQLVSGLWLLLSRELLHCTNDFPLARLVILWILFFLRTPGSGLEEKISCWSISLSLQSVVALWGVTWYEMNWWAFRRYLLRVCFKKKTISRMNDGEINVLMAGKLCWGEEIWFILMWQSGEGARNYYYILIKYLFAPCVTFMARLRRQ